jgi:signal transduction histidine kinase
MATGVADSINATTLTTAVVSIVLASLVWWRRFGRLARLRLTVGRIYSLSEEILGANTAPAILAQLEKGLDDILELRNAAILLKGAAEGELEKAAGSLQSPDAARRCLATGAPVLEQASVSLPMMAQGQTTGVLQCHSPHPIHLQSDELAALKHLANQVAIALQLSDQRLLREQLLRSEKLGAAGQLIASVASELRPHLERTAAAARQQQLPDLAASSESAIETLDRLISFGHPDRARVEPLDLNAVIRQLAEFRAQPWRMQMAETELALGPGQIIILGSRSQLEQALLSLLVHAEQALQQAGKGRLIISTSAHESRARVEIEFPTALASNHGHQETWGVAVAQGIVESHGGAFYTLDQGQSTRFQIDLPTTESRPEQPSLHLDRAPVRPLTLLLVHPSEAALRPLIAILAARQHRVVPATNAGEAVEFSSRFRFDAVFSAPQLPDGAWTDFVDTVRANTPVCGTLNSPADPATPGILSLPLPVDELQVDRALESIAATD